MSISLLAKVFYIDPKTCDQPEKCVLSALADHANDEGYSVWPSNARLAWKSSMSVRGIQKVIDRLIEKKFVEIVREANNGRTTNEYRLVVEEIEAVSANHKDRFFDGPDGLTHEPRSGAPLNPVHPTPEPRSPEPSYKPSKETPETENDKTGHSPASHNLSHLRPQIMEVPSHLKVKEKMTYTGRCDQCEQIITQSDLACPGQGCGRPVQWIGGRTKKETGRVTKPAYGPLSAFTLKVLKFAQGTVDYKFDWPSPMKGQTSSNLEGRFLSFEQSLGEAKVMSIIEKCGQVGDKGLGLLKHAINCLATNSDPTARGQRPVASQSLETKGEIDWDA